MQLTFIPNAHGARPWTLVLLSLLLLGFSQEVWAIRIKDIAYLRGARDNQLIGYGLVVGLDGTGDSEESLLSRKPLRNALERMAISLSAKDIRGRSIAGVLVTATMPPFSKAGSRIDVTVDTLGNAVSLRGGTLMYTLLQGANQVVYSTAQGPITGIPKGIERQIPGETPELSEAEIREIRELVDRRSSLVPTKGYVSRGGVIEREINLNLNTRSRVYINLKSSDFTTAFRLAKLVNREFGDGSALAKDAGTIEVSIPDSYLGQTVEMMSRIENLEINPDTVAKVVVDERSGTIVMGQDVRISPIAISHGNLNIEIRAPAASSGEKTEGEESPPATTAFTLAETPSIILFKGEVDLKEVVDGLNKIGASNSDLVQVLKIIKTSGALHADLIIR